MTATVNAPRRARPRDVLDDVRRPARLREADHRRARHVERRAVVDGECDRVAHRGPARAAARTRRRRTRPHCRTSRARRCGRAGVARRGRSPRDARDLAVVLEQPSERGRLLADLGEEPRAGLVAVLSRRQASHLRRASARPRARRRGRRRRQGRPGRAARGRERPSTRAGTALAASSARSSGTPTATRLRTASIIVSALPASIAVLAADDVVGDDDLDLAERVRSVAETRAGDRVGDERDAGRPPRATGAARCRGRDGRRRRSPGRRRRTRRARRRRRRVAVRERAHRVEDVGHRADAPVERGVGLVGGRVRWPSETMMPRASRRSTRSSAPGSSGASVTSRTGPASSSRSSSASSGSRRAPRRCVPSRRGGEERPFEVRRRGSAARASVPGRLDARRARAPREVISVGRYAVTPVSRSASPASAKPVCVRPEEVDPGEPVHLQVDEARRGDPAADARRGRRPSMRPSSTATSPGTRRPSTSAASTPSLIARAPSDDAARLRRAALAPSRRRPRPAA